MTPESQITVLTDSLSALAADAPEREPLLIQRGMLYWKCGKRAEAINDYNAAIRLNPSSEAVELRRQAYSILDFYHRDLYNP